MYILLDANLSKDVNDKIYNIWKQGKLGDAEDDVLSRDKIEEGWSDVSAVDNGWCVRDWIWREFVSGSGWLAWKYIRTA